MRIPQCHIYKFGHLKSNGIIMIRMAHNTPNIKISKLAITLYLYCAFSSSDNFLKSSEALDKTFLNSNIFFIIDHRSSVILPILFHIALIVLQMPLQSFDY